MTSIEEFCQMFKDARESKGLSLETIHEKTRVSLDVLKALEVGQFDIIPETYIRPYVKVFAKEIGLDPDEVMTQFNELVGVNTTSFVKTSRDSEFESDFTDLPSETDDDIKDTPMVLSRNLLISVGAVILVLIVVVLKFCDSAPPEAQIVKEDQGIKEISVEEMVEELEQANTDADIGTSLVLIIAAKETTWVRIITDRADSLELIFYPNDRRRFTADREYELRIGNPLGIDLELSGQLLGALAPVSTVISKLVLTKDGIQERSYFTPQKNQIERSQNQ